MASKSGKSTSSGKSNASSNSNTNTQLKKLHKKLGTRLIIIFITVALFLAGLVVENKIDVAASLAYEQYKGGTVIEEGGLKIHFLDVKQGDACIIELPDNRVMMIDAGEKNNSIRDSIFDYIDKINENRAASERPAITYLDFFVVTHSDSDHVGNAPEVLNEYPAKTFYRPNQKTEYGGTNIEIAGYTDPALSGSASGGFWGEGQPKACTTAIYARTIKAGYAANSAFTPKGIVTNPYDNTQNCIKPSVAKSDVNYYEINFYGPTQASYSDDNNYSPIILIEYSGRKIVLAGDCETAGEAGFVQNITNNVDRYQIFTDEFSVDIIKLSHHGSSTSSSVNYLQALTVDCSAVYAVISVGQGNSYGHPHSSTLTRLNDMGFLADNILRTDQSGNLVFAVYAADEGRGALLFGDQIVSDAGQKILIYKYQIGGFDIRYRYLGAVAAAIIILLVLLSYIFYKRTPQKKKTTRKR